MYALNNKTSMVPEKIVSRMGDIPTHAYCVAFGRPCEDKRCPQAYKEPEEANKEEKPNGRQ